VLAYLCTMACKEDVHISVMPFVDTVKLLIEAEEMCLALEMHRRFRHFNVAVFKNGFTKSARRHLYVTVIKYFSEAVIVPPVKRSTVGSRSQSEYAFHRQLKTWLFKKSFSEHHHLILTAS